MAFWSMRMDRSDVDGVFDPFLRSQELTHQLPRRAYSRHVFGGGIF
jgi:hypothetical protein